MDFAALYGEDKREYDKHDYLLLIVKDSGFRLVLYLHRFHLRRLPGVM